MQLNSIVNPGVCTMQQPESSSRPWFNAMLACTRLARCSNTLLTPSMLDRSANRTRVVFKLPVRAKVFQEKGERSQIYAWPFPPES